MCRLFFLLLASCTRPAKQWWACFWLPEAKATTTLSPMLAICQHRPPTPKARARSKQPLRWSPLRWPAPRLPWQKKIRACKTCSRFGPSPVPTGHRLDLPDPRCKRPAGVRPGIGQRIAGQGGRHAQSGAVLAARHHFQRGRNPKQPCRRLGHGGGGGLTELHCAGAQLCRPWRQQRHAAPLPVFGAHGGIACGLSDRRQNLAPVAQELQLLKFDSCQRLVAGL